MHLTQAQRYEIAALLKTGTSQKKIAEVIGVHPSTICREIKRNLTSAGNYSPTQAHMFAKERQDWKSKARAKLTNAMKADIVQCIVERKWSPEQIAGRRKLEGKPMVGKTSIYKFLHQNKKAGGELYKHTRHGLAYRKRRLAVPIKTDWPKRKSIETRPECIDQKERVGDFEMDTIIGKEQKGAILTLVERVTGFTIIRLLEHGKDRIFHSKLFWSGKYGRLARTDDLAYCIRSGHNAPFADISNISFGLILLLKNEFRSPL